MLKKAWKPHITLAAWNAPPSTGDWARDLVRRRTVAWLKGTAVLVIAVAILQVLVLLFPALKAGRY